MKRLSIQRRLRIVVALVAVTGLHLFGTDTQPAHGGLVSSALVGALDTAATSSEVIVAFRAVDRNRGTVVWESSRSSITESRSAGRVVYRSNVPADIANAQGVDLVMWVYAVRSDDPVRFSSYHLVDSDDRTHPAALPVRDYRGRIGEARVSR